VGYFLPSLRDLCKAGHAEKRRKLFPIPLTDNATLKKWECLDSATGAALAAAVRKHHLPDFSNWPPPAAFARAFARLEKDLPTSLGKYQSAPAHFRPDSHPFGSKVSHLQQNHQN
jgi:hypothetical protein